MMQFRGELPSKLMVETDAMARRVADMKKDLQVVADEIRGDGSADRMIGQLEYAIDHQVLLVWSCLCSLSCFMAGARAQRMKWKMMKQSSHCARLPMRD